MKRLLFIFICLSFNIYLFAQKQIKEYTIQELNLKKKEALAGNDANNAEVYDLAIKYKSEIDAAIKVEDYEKAALFQEKITKLKTIPLLTEKIKELQDELSKAVAKEDYEKAEMLKKEIESLKGTNKNTTNSSNISSSSITQPSSISPSPSTGISKNSIYDASVVWMGLDFSLFNYVSNKKVGEEQEHKKNIPIWQSEFHNQTGSEKLGKWLKKTQYIDDRSYTENLYNTNLNRSWIISQKTTLSKDKIQKHLLSYKTTKHGLALVFIPETFDEIEREITIQIIWFDLDSKAIVSVQSINFKGVNPGTMSNRWGAALLDCTKTYIDQYFRKKL